MPADDQQNARARRLAALHKPGDPVLLTNVYDGATARIAASHAGTQALATASFAIAETHGVRDPELTLPLNLAGVRAVMHALRRANPDMPLTADCQDGYGNVGASIKALIAEGVVGANIEDVSSATGELFEVDEAVARVRAAVSAAKEAGVPDFVVNARTDVLVYGGSVDEAIARGQAFLKGGATNVYVWGGPKGRGVSRDEVRQLVQALDGRLNVKMNLRAGFLTRPQLAELGVARISVGPELYHKAMAAFQDALEGAVEGRAF